MKKVLLVLLAVVMIVAVFVSCGDSAQKTTPKATTPKQSGSGDITEEIPESQKLNIDIDSIDYGGETVRIIHSRCDYAEYGMEEDQIGNDAINDAIYKRNLYIETDLGIELEFNEEPYSYDKITTFMDKLSAWTSDPNTHVDIISAFTRMMPYILIEGYLTDLNIYNDSLDFDKEWWPEGVAELHEIKGNLYFVTGDISPNVLRSMTGVFVNKTILKSRGFDYDQFMQKVENYEWTIDDLIEMSSGIWANGDDATATGPSVDDFFGCTTAWKHFDALYVGCGFKYMTGSNKDNEVMKLAADLFSEKVANWMSKIQDWQRTNDFHCGAVGSDLYEDNFIIGQSLFVVHRALYGFDLQKTDIDYAIVPTPMLDTAQGRYYTTIGYGYTSYGICNYSPDYDRAAQSIQLFGYYGYKLTTPAVFEVSFKGKFSKDDYTIKMFDIIRESITFDLGRIYDVIIAGGGERESWRNYPEYLISFCISGGIDGWTTDRVWTTEFGSAKQITMRNLVTAANEKLLAYIDAN